MVSIHTAPPLELQWGPPKKEHHEFNNNIEALFISQDGLGMRFRRLLPSAV
jgi:hypothetical protein